MVSCQGARCTILQCDGFQEASGLAKSACDDPRCSSGRGADPGSEALIAQKSDCQSGDVRAHQYRRGLRSGEPSRVRPLFENRSQLDIRAGIPPPRGSRPGRYPRIRLTDPDESGSRSKKDAIRPSSGPRHSPRGRKACHTNHDEPCLIDVVVLATRNYASAVSHLCISGLPFCVNPRPETAP